MRTSNGNNANLHHEGSVVGVEKMDIQKLKEQAAAARIELERKIPGISELENTLSDWENYHWAWRSAMEDEYNDGVRMPCCPEHRVEEVEKKYPLAALYLKADAYSHASNYHKSLAGEKAKKLLLEGGSMEEAQEILDNWLPASAIWD